MPSEVSSRGKPQRPQKRSVASRLGLPDLSHVGPWWLPLVFGLVLIPQFVSQSMHFHHESTRLLGYAGCAVLVLCFVWGTVLRRRLHAAQQQQQENER